MASMNRVILLGNLTRDPEVRYTGSGKAVCNIGMAVNERYKDRDETLFVDVTAWGKSAEACGRYLSKGAAVLVEGKMQLEQWETKEGAKRSKHVVVAHKVTFLTSGDAQSNEDAPDSGENERTPAEQGDTAPSDDKDDNLPF